MLYVFILCLVLRRPAVGNEDITANGSSVRRHVVPLVCSAQSHIWQRYMTACAHSDGSLSNELAVH